MMAGDGVGGGFGWSGCFQFITFSYELNETFEIKGIAVLTNVPSNPKQKLKRLCEFEGYWQLKLNTIKSHGLNDINELKECRNNLLVAH